MRFCGVWLPFITPFKDGEVDYAGYERLVDHYVRAGVSGVIPRSRTRFRSSTASGGRA